MNATAKKPLTIRQYLAQVKRALPEVESQVDAWPYPQARQSHLNLWLPSFPAGDLRLPEKRVRIYLDGSDCPGTLMTIRRGEPPPSQAVAELRRRNAN